METTVCCKFCGQKRDTWFFISTPEEGFEGSRTPTCPRENKAPISYLQRFGQWEGGVFCLHPEELAALHLASVLKFLPGDQAHPAGDPPWKARREPGCTSPAFRFPDAGVRLLPLVMPELQRGAETEGSQYGSLAPPFASGRLKVWVHSGFRG